MKPHSPIAIILVLSVLVVVSAAAGFFVGHYAARKNIALRNDPGNWNEHVSHEFDRLVKPSPEQAVRIQAALDSAVRDLQALRLETITRTTNVIWRLISEVEKELTPEQLQAFEQMKPRPTDLTLDLLQVKPPSPNTREEPNR